MLLISPIFSVILVLDGKKYLLHFAVCLWLWAWSYYLFCQWNMSSVGWKRFLLWGVWPLFWKSFLLPCEQASANSPGGEVWVKFSYLETFSVCPWNHENSLAVVLFKPLNLGVLSLHKAKAHWWSTPSSALPGSPVPSPADLAFSRNKHATLEEVEKDKSYNRFSNSLSNQLSLYRLPLLCLKFSVAESWTFLGGCFLAFSSTGLGFSPYLSIIIVHQWSNFKNWLLFSPLFGLCAVKRNSFIINLERFVKELSSNTGVHVREVPIKLL